MGGVLGVLSCVLQYSGRNERDRKYKTLVPGHKDFGLMEVTDPSIPTDLFVGIVYAKACLHRVDVKFSMLDCDRSFCNSHSSRMNRCTLCVLYACFTYVCASC